MNTCKAYLHNQVHKKENGGKLPKASVNQAMLIYRQPTRIAPLTTASQMAATLNPHSGRTIRDGQPQPPSLKQKTLAAELANSPYMNPAQRLNYRFERTKQIIASVQQNYGTPGLGGGGGGMGSGALAGSAVNASTGPATVVGVSNEIKEAITRKRQEAGCCREARYRIILTSIYAIKIVVYFYIYL